MAGPRSAVFLPLSAQSDDAETVTWCRGLPLVIAEDLAQLRLARASWAAWTAGAAENLRMCHLVQSAPAEHVAAWARAARSDLGICGMGSWHGDPFVRWDVVDIAVPGPAERIIIDAPEGASRVQVARRAWTVACKLIGLPGAPLSPLLQSTEVDAALQAWFQDRELHWFRRKRGAPAPAELGFRHMLAAITHDPRFEPAAREIVRRAGDCLANREPGGRAFESPTCALAADALETLLRLRTEDARAWTLLGMIRQAMDDAGGAMDAWRRACSLAPDYAPAHRELGAALRDRQDLRGAGAYLRRAGALSPMDPDTHLQLGALYAELKQRDRAREHLQSVLHLAGGTRTAVNAARLLRDLDEGPSRRAGESLQRPKLRTSPDRDLIARTFAAPGDRLTNPGIDAFSDGPGLPAEPAID